MKLVPKPDIRLSAKLFFITQEGPGMFFVNLDDGKTFTKIQINRAQLGNAVADGAIMTLRSTETRR